MARRKRSKLQRLQKEADQLVAKLVKLRDGYVCQWCGKQCTTSNCHASHVIPKSLGNGLRWDLMNLKTLCFHCHINLWHKNPVEAADWFKNKFPERWEYLHKQERLWQCKEWEMEELVAKLKEKLKEFA